MNKELIRLIETQITLALNFKIIIESTDWTDVKFITSRSIGEALADGDLSYSVIDSNDQDELIQENGKLKTRKKETEEDKQKKAEIAKAKELQALRIAVKYTRKVYNQELLMIKGLIDKRNKILKTATGFHDNMKVREIYYLVKNMVELHLERCKTYQDNIKPTDDQLSIREEEIGLMTDIADGELFVITNMNSIGLEDEFNKDQIELHKNTKFAPLYMFEFFFNEYPDIKKGLLKKGFDMNPINDNKMHIHNDNPPIWNTNRHFFDQDIETLQYYYNELMKIRSGIVVGGIHIEPWMYFHLNFFKINEPTKYIRPGSDIVENRDVIKEPSLRDNEWLLIQEAFKEAKRKGQMVFIGATRRYAKTTMIASHLQWKILDGGFNLVLASSNGRDLGHICTDLQLSLNNVNKAFETYLTSADWEKEVNLGVRYTNNKIINNCIIHINNMDSGTAKKSEKLAGFTADAFVIDEIMKSPFKRMLEGAWPALMSPHGLRCIPLLSGCLTAGNKVYTREGKRINIEDLKYEDGIIGYNKDTYKYSPEGISHINPPQSKECVKIKTRSGIEIECSTDHPFLIPEKNKEKWVEAGNLKNTNRLIFPNKVDFTGVVEMKNPYFRGFYDVNFPDNIELHKEKDIKLFLKGIIEFRHKKHKEGIKIKFLLKENAKNIQSILFRFGIYTILEEDTIFIYGNKSINKVKKCFEIKSEIIDEILKKNNKELKVYYKQYILDDIVSIESVGMKPVYNLTTDTTHTYLANGVVTHNTGGNDDLAQDAFTMLKNPELNHVMQMNWDFLNKYVEPEHRTWREQPFGIFAPGQMSSKQGMIKNKITLAKFLKIDNPELEKIEIQATDWANNTEELRRVRKSLSADPAKQIAEIVYHPMSPEEIYMSAKVSPFPVTMAKAHLEHIRELGEIGRKVKVIEKEGKIIFLDSNDPLPTFPNTQSNIDAPIVIYEEPEEGIIPADLYIASLDDYKQETSGTNSVGAFYIMKRQSGMDPMGNRIVASLGTRPLPHRKFHRTMRLLMKKYNSMCLMENEDMAFKDYLDTLMETDRWLVPTFDLKGNLEVKKNANRRYGISPKGNKSQIINQVINYCNEEDVEIPDGKGGVRLGLGVERINDELLLEEIINYNEGLNVDRIIAFGIALIYMQLLDSNYIKVPTSQGEVRVQERREIPKMSYAISRGTIGGKKFSRGGKSRFKR